MNVQLQDLVFWQGKLGVLRAPSVVFLRGPGAVPAVYDASNTKRLDIAKLIADNAWQVMQCMYVCNMLLCVTHMAAQGSVTLSQAYDPRLEDVTGHAQPMLAVLMLLLHAAFMS